MNLRSVLTLSATLLLGASPLSAGEVAPLTAKELVFSITNMDQSVDPRKDFYAFASGTWQRTAVRPDRMQRIGSFDYMGDHRDAQMKSALAKAAEDARKARKGSTVQLNGDFFAAFMDTARIDALGMKPLQPELDRIAAISSMKEFSRYIGRYQNITGDFLLIAFGPGRSRTDKTKMITASAPGTLASSYPVIYTSADHSSEREAYRAAIRDSLVIAGYAPERAARMAETFVRIETAIYHGVLTPTEHADPHNTNTEMTLRDLQKRIPQLDLKAIFKPFGVKPPRNVVLLDNRYPESLAKILQENSLDDLKDYATWAVIRKFIPVLPTKFDEAWKPFNKTLFGSTELAPRDARAIAIMTKNMGQPLSRLYVESYFTGETRASAAEMIGRVKSVFLARMKKNEWLTAPTKARALEKLEKLSFAVGYPDTWIDYSKIDIRRDDALGNLMRLQQTMNLKEQKSINKPPHRDGFANSDATLPFLINAAYDSQLNGFELPAAIIQPPAFEPGKDAAVNYCKLGAVLGHEMTHGFDSTGRNFDANGELRDWWTPADTAAFQKQADKLIAQASGYEILPGLRINGAQTVTENMADVGGITLAYEALKQYLAEHPAEDKPIDGFTPAQRCFIAWTQFWTTKEQEQSVRRTVAADNHPPNQYRATAPLQHVDDFYAAFGIKEGDPMWLAPEKRLKAW